MLSLLYIFIIDMLSAFINWALVLFEGMGYVGVFILMTIESSFLPFPSELAIPPAAYLASQGKMDIFLIIVLGTLGSLLGALINYYLALWLGRPLVYKLVETKAANFLRLKKSDLERAEAMFLKNANKATFVCRLIPVVRQLISIPAGFTRMPLVPFIILTTLGSLLWVVVLAIFGYTLGANQELLLKYYHELKIILLAAAGIWLVYYLLKLRVRKNKVIN